jgi:hypothetical protein
VITAAATAWMIALRRKAEGTAVPAMDAPSPQAT